MGCAEPYEPGKNPRQFGPEPPDALYNADAIEYSDADLPVLLVPRDEIEAAEKIFDSHVVSAVTGPLTPLDLLKGRLVTIWPKNDAEQLAARIKEAGAAEIRMVQIPADWPADWTIKRGEHDPEIRPMLRELLDEAQPWKPTASGRKSENRSGNGAGKTGPVWLEPEPIIVIPERHKYPLDALPPGVFEAVKEAIDFDQYPPELAACSAISALSLVGQGLANVARNDQLKSPVSINSLVEAPSGERKTTADKRFCGVILEYQREQAKALRPKLEEYNAAFSAWEAMCAGVKERIKKNKKEKKDTASDEKELKDLKGREPSKPRVPTYHYGDVTREGLAYNLHTVWPSAGLISAEGGVVFGGHAAQNEAVMGFLAMANVLWDGVPYSVTRRQSESYILDGVRLTIGIAVQHETVKAFHEKTGGISRGIGFLARFLIACPESTAGTREWRERQHAHFHCMRPCPCGLCLPPMGGCLAGYQRDHPVFSLSLPSRRRAALVLLPRLRAKSGEALSLFASFSLPPLFGTALRKPAGNNTRPGLPKGV